MLLFFKTHYNHYTVYKRLSNFHHVKLVKQSSPCLSLLIIIKPGAEIVGLL